MLVVCLLQVFSKNKHSFNVEENVRNKAFCTVHAKLQ